MIYFDSNPLLGTHRFCVHLFNQTLPMYHILQYSIICDTSLGFRVPKKKISTVFNLVRQCVVSNAYKFVSRPSSGTDSEPGRDETPTIYFPNRFAKRTLLLSITVERTKINCLSVYHRCIPITTDDKRNKPYSRSALLVNRRQGKWYKNNVLDKENKENLADVYA